MAPSVAAVIVNYNGMGFVDRCLDSLLRQSQPPHEIVVVDNCSSDGSDRLVESRYPQIHLLRPAKNLGYAGGCNLGIENTQSELVAVLNNDIVLQEDWLENLMKAVHPPWSFWASRIVFDSDPNVIDSAGDGMAVVGAAFKIGHGCLSSGYLETREVFGPCGAAALYRRDLLIKTGGFDQDFFLIYEDADLSMRARLLGYRCCYVPTAVVRHRVNQSIGRFTRTYVYYGQRNSEILFWKTMPASLLLRYLPERLLFDLVSLAYFTIRGRLASFLEAKLDTLRMAGSILSKRRRIQSKRTMDPAEIRTQLERNWLRHRRKPTIE